MNFESGIHSYRPLIMGTTHVVSTGHHLATAAGYRILEEGGNAVDAGVAAGIALNVVLPHLTSFGGVAPIIIHDSQKQETVSISGVGGWPKAASIDFFKRHAKGELPVGVLRTVTPAAADAWLTALRLYGTMSFEQVVTPALELSAQGFPVSSTLLNYITNHQFPIAAMLNRALIRWRWLPIPEALVRAARRRLPVPAMIHGALVRISMRRLPVPAKVGRLLGVIAEQLAQDAKGGRSWDSTNDSFLPRGRLPKAGTLLKQRDLARTFHRLIEVERASASRGREAAIQAARDFFYRGEIAEEIVGSCQERGGLLTMEDLAEFQVKLEPLAVGSYKGIDVYTGGPWCQGPVTIEALRILEGCDLKGMGHNSADYLHTLIEALKLAFADRYAYYGDPEFVDVPLDGLISESYAAERRLAIDIQRACPEMPFAGNPWPHQGSEQPATEVTQPEPVAAVSLEGDTSCICVIDQWGNAFSATPSDGFSMNSPLVRGLGFSISPRGAQTWLDPAHPASLSPGKRPLLTPSPAMAFKDGKVWLTFGSPGGDVQCQAMVQLFLNIIEFGMDPQQAMEAPRVASLSFPNSFWPHAYHPGWVNIEGRIDSHVVAELRQRGHKVTVCDDWATGLGALCAVEVDRENGNLKGGADPRKDGYAIGR